MDGGTDKQTSGHTDRHTVRQTEKKRIKYSVIFCNKVNCLGWGIQRIPSIWTSDQDGLYTALWRYLKQVMLSEIVPAQSLKWSRRDTNFAKSVFVNN